MVAVPLFFCIFFSTIIFPVIAAGENREKLPITGYYYDSVKGKILPKYGDLTPEEVEKYLRGEYYGEGEEGEGEEGEGEGEEGEGGEGEEGEGGEGEEGEGEEGEGEEEGGKGGGKEGGKGGGKGGGKEGGKGR